MVGPE